MRRWRVRFEDPRPSDFYAPDPSRRGRRGLVSGSLRRAVVGLLSRLSSADDPRGVIFEFVGRASARCFRGLVRPFAGSSLYESLVYVAASLAPGLVSVRVQGTRRRLWSDGHSGGGDRRARQSRHRLLGEIAILLRSVARAVALRTQLAIVAVGLPLAIFAVGDNPKGLEFSYYFFPSILCLGPALALFFFSRRSGLGSPRRLPPRRRLGFVFFLPVLAAGIGVTPGDLDARTWLPAWRWRRLASSAEISHGKAMNAPLLPPRRLPAIGRPTLVLRASRRPSSRRLRDLRAALLRAAAAAGFRARILAFPPAGAQFLVSVPTLTMAPSLVLAGSASDVFGRKRTMVASLAAAALATLAASLAPNLQLLSAPCAR